MLREMFSGGSSPVTVVMGMPPGFFFRLYVIWLRSGNKQGLEGLLDRTTGTLSEFFRI